MATPAKLETALRDKMQELQRHVIRAQRNGGNLTTKQIVDLVVAIDPLIQAMDGYLKILDPKKNPDLFEEAVQIRDVNAELRDALNARTKNLH